MGGSHIFTFHNICYIPILDSCCKDTCVLILKFKYDIREEKKDAHVFSKMTAKI